MKKLILLTKRDKEKLMRSDFIPTTMRKSSFFALKGMLYPFFSYEEMVYERIKVRL